MNGDTAEGKYTRISEAWSKNFDEMRTSQVLEAIKGEWGSERTDEDLHVAKFGKAVLWQKLGAGTKTIRIPKSPYRYYCKIFSESGCLECQFIEAGKEQITISKAEDQRWQVEGMFIQEN